MADSSSKRAVETKKDAAPIRFLRRLVSEKPLGSVGAIITLLLLLVGIFADQLAPYGMNESHLGEFLVAPSFSKYWLGTDVLGRDVLSRVIYGARVSVIVGLSASIWATIVSVVIGTMSGYIGGKFDLFVQRFVDTWMCFPSIVVLMVVMSVLGSGMLQMILMMGIMSGVRGSRTIRGATIGIKENVYIEAAKATGCSTLKILTRHILPNIMAPTLILFTTRVPAMIMLEASLSFLGFGIPPPAPSWGNMLSGNARQYMYVAPWIVIWPGVALASVVYGINMFGDAVRDLLDPRLRERGGRFGVKMKTDEIDSAARKEGDSRA